MEDADFIEDDGSFVREDPLPAPEPIKLEEGIYLKDLTDGKGTLFSLKVKEENEMFTESNSYFSSDQLLVHSRPECIDGDEVGETDADNDIGKTPFESLATKMVDVSQDGKVKKRIKKEGEGQPIPPYSLVTVNYNAYREYEDEPYDSTFLRRNPFVFRMGEGMCLPGLEAGIASMKKAEVSQLLVHPDLAFGPRGCPPRIPPNAHLMFEVTLVAFEDAQTAEMFDGMCDEEVQQAEFSKVMAAAKEKHNAGKDLYKRQAIIKAASKFEDAIRLLNNILSIPTEKDQKEHQTLLLVLHTNLAIIYNSTNEAARACVHCRHALEIEPKNAKTYLHYGRALLQVGDYAAAMEKLKVANKILPNNVAVNREMSKVNEVWQKHIKVEQDIARRMVSDCRITTPEEQRLLKMPKDDQEFLVHIKAKLADFLKDDDHHLAFPPGISVVHRRIMQEEAEKLDLVYQMITGTEGSGQHVCISKPTQSDN